MRNVILTKVRRDHIVVLQAVMAEYATDFGPYLEKPQIPVDFYYSVAQVEISQRLIKAFRNKIESDSQSFRLNLKASEAITLLNACSNVRVTTTNAHTAHVCEVYKNEIDEIVKSLFTVVKTADNQTLLIN